jgi:hypothetical protein
MVSLKTATIHQWWTSSFDGDLAFGLSQASLMLLLVNRPGADLLANSSQTDLRMTPRFSEAVSARI